MRGKFNVLVVILILVVRITFVRALIDDECDHNNRQYIILCVYCIHIGRCTNTCTEYSDLLCANGRKSFFVADKS